MTSQFNCHKHDKRSQQSWHKIRDAFVKLVLSKRYDQINVSEIIIIAGVARSTFYEHFANKDAILAQSLSPPLSQFAKSIHDNASFESLQSIVQHFWENRSFCRLILKGTPRKAVLTMLTELIEQELILKLAQQNQALIITTHHVAHQIAESQLALLETWLLGKAHTTDENITLAIKQTSNAIVSALVAK